MRRVVVPGHADTWGHQLGNSINQALAGMLDKNATETVGGVKTFSNQPIIPAGNVVATGSTQTDAAPLVAGFRAVSGADGTKGVVLPASVPGTSCYVKNTDPTNSLKVYPPVGSAINGGSVNAAVTVGTSNSKTFNCTDTTNWHS